jgi:hypothetical protein
MWLVEIDQDWVVLYTYTPDTQESEAGESLDGG